MKYSYTLFSAQEIKKIEKAIAQAENGTSAEIVPVIAKQSGRYQRAEGLFALLFSLFTLIVFWLIAQHFELFTSWNSTVSTGLPLFMVLLLIILVYSIGLLIGNAFPVLKILFTPKDEQSDTVKKTSEQVFFKHKIRNTKDATGILIYISLLEHRVQILGDEAISKKLSNDDWEKVRDLILDGFKQGHEFEGLENAIACCGELLCEHFPKQVDDQNELPNKLIFLD